MSNTDSDKVDNVLGWLEKNAFWNADILSVEESKTTSGVGVFLKTDSSEDEDNLLLRIPKANILSSKNTFICNLLNDFNELYSGNPDVNLTKGMHSVVISFIYELYAGKNSPWFDYVSTIDPKQENDEFSNIPICLWTTEEKEMLKNTECDLLGMLNSDELVQFYIECIRFAHINEKYAGMPEIFDLELPSDSNELESFLTRKHFEKVVMFAKYVQTVISRAFAVDDFHGLSLVPGADLFNHIVPVMQQQDETSKIQGRENVHFVCDGDDVCTICGESNCENHDEDEDEEEEMIEEIEEEEEEENDGIDEHEEEDMEDDEDGLVENDLASSSDSEGSDENNESDEHDENQSDQESDTEEIPEISEITMDYIKEMEDELDDDEDSEAETAKSDEEVSTLSLSEDEAESMPNTQTGHSMSAEEELAAQLSDSSQCCDIVLTNPPLEEYKYELFNTYGNTLSNPYLLQRYGFVNDFKEPNVNDSCLLSVQMFSYLKNYKKNNSGIKVKQLDVKLQWYEEIGFDIVNDLVNDYESAHQNEDDHEHHGDHEHEDGGGCCDNEGEDAEMTDNTTPETWQLSPVVRYDGSLSPQTYSLLKIILMPYKLFQSKLVKCETNRKLSRRILHLLLPYENTSQHEEIHQLIKDWCQSRLSRYNDYTSMKASTKVREEIIHNLIKQEQCILQRVINKLS
ncbi:uncharacterized protein AC631_04217 [Debaryomyces fabryi]|uniref:Ribosomal lysine N-methyltransferase 3 n=1 Tax=Debaryomyces fabryi TaxID=58627 RepID=A0A0V1PUU5_9ASCO|nr:uncharacterized protein AC631_04217 [Debaryomyces fabryi]KSA00029.1 hypothetical protein AC631_04217 [Debaryomyces fabryi]CUM49328.1 unnamed protein product [Debaryomyces fabryi]